MAKLDGINVDINAKLTVDNRTAEACLRLVEIYINTAPFKLVSKWNENGETELWYEPT